MSAPINGNNVNLNLTLLSNTLILYRSLYCRLAYCISMIIKDKSHAILNESR